MKRGEGSEDQWTLGADGPGVGLSGDRTLDRVFGLRGASRIELDGVEYAESGSGGVGERDAVITGFKRVWSGSMEEGVLGAVWM